MARSRRTDDWDDDDDDLRRKPSRSGQADVLGVAGLGFGILGALCLVLGCVTCGLTFYGVAPFAAVGTCCSAYGRGPVRVAGLIVNIVTLIPGIPIFGFMVFGIGMDLVVPPRQGN
jgi:hypothetical protein